MFANAIDQIPETDLAVIIKSSPGKVFSAGHNLKEMIDKDQKFYKELFSKLPHAIEKLKALSQPVIAHINGMAYAAGCQLALSCDVIYATKNSSFAVPGIRVGLFCHTPGVSLLRSISSSKRAFEMLVTGDPISAQTALELGMINNVADSEEELDELTNSFIKKIAPMSQKVLRFGKQSFYQMLAQRDNFDAMYQVAENNMIENCLHKDAQEGFSAFSQKRQPKWT